MGWEIGRVPCPWFAAVAPMDDDERPDPDCRECHGTGDVPGWDADNETLIWYPCGCLSE